MSTKMKRTTKTRNICFETINKINILFLKQTRYQAEYSISIVDAVRTIRKISVDGLKPCTFKSWVEEIINYLSSMHGNNLHVFFDNYSYEYSVPSKQSDVSQLERVIKSSNQENGMSFWWFIKTSFKLSTYY